MTKPDKAYYGEFSDSWTRALKKDERINVIEIEKGEFGIDEGTHHVKFRLKDLDEFDNEDWNLLVNRLLDKTKDNLNHINEEYNDNLRTRHIWSDEAIEFYIDELEHEYNLIQTKINELDKKLKLFSLKVSLLSAEMTPKQD